MQRAEPLDWLSLAALTVMFGSAFMLIKLAVQELPPSIVATARIEVAAILLLGIALLRKVSFGFLRSSWLLVISLAIFGNCLPFYLISWGQQKIDSSVAGILMAVMPLATIVLARYFVPGEKLKPMQVLGFLSGFGGVLVLLGPAAIAEFGNSTQVFFPMLAVLAGALCYAVNTIIAKHLPDESLLAVSAAVLVIAGLIMLPAWFLTGQDVEIRLFSTGVFSVILLGVFPTAIATLIYFALIARAGPSFLSQSNYLIPVWAVFMGTVFLGEPLNIRAYFALAIILASVALAGHRSPSVNKL